MEIPGFHYDPIKKKYFKIEKNAANHVYTSSSLKHKREEEELKESISRIKLNLRRNISTFESHELELRNRIRHQPIQSVRSYYQEYVISRLTLHTKKKFAPFLSSNHMPVRQMLVDKSGRVIVCYDNGLFVLPKVDLKSPETILPDIQFVNGALEDSVLRSSEIFGDGIFRLWSGIMNTPSRLSLFKNDGEIYQYTFDNELLNSSKFNRDTKEITFVGNKKLRIWDSSFRKVTETSSKGDCLSVDNQGQMSYLGYRNGSLKIWDARSKALNDADNFKNCVMNISNVSDHELLISTFDDIFLWDIRNSAKSKSFNSHRLVVNPFEENLTSISESDKSLFMLQNSKIIEVFHCKFETPLKTIFKADFGNESINFCLYNEDENTALTALGNNTLIITS